MTSNYKIVAASAVVTLDEVAGIALIDSKKLSNDPESYVKDNMLSYYVITNTWIKLIKSVSEYSAELIKAMILQNGLADVVAGASSAAGELAREESISLGHWASLYGELQFKERSQSLFTRTWDSRPVSAFRTMNQILKYPKRFSPLHATVNNDAAKRKFDNFQKDARKKFRNDSMKTKSKYVVRMMQHMMADILEWDPLCDEIEKALADPSNFKLTHGAGYDAKPIISEKVREVSKVPGAIDPVFGVSVVSADMSQSGPSWEDNSLSMPVYNCLVPKNMDGPRIIAEEPTYRQARARYVAAIIERYLPNSIHLRDQGYNRTACKHAVYYGLATVDFSQASDSVLTRFAAQIFPARFWNLIEPLLPTQYTWDRKELKALESAATMGNSLTFILESIYFLCAAEVATWWATFGTDSPHTVRLLALKGEDDVHRDVSIPCVYGDDVVILSCAVEALTYIGECLGLTVNLSKTFCEPLKYRESCGVEYYDDKEVSIVYYPRRPIEGTISPEAGKVNSKYSRDTYTDELSDSLTSLVKLQHHLFQVDIGAAMFLKELILWCVPEMTTSTPGSESTDLWDYADAHAERQAPYAQIAHYRALDALGKPTGAYYLDSSVKCVKRKISFNFKDLAPKDIMSLMSMKMSPKETAYGSGKAFTKVHNGSSICLNLVQDLYFLGEILKICRIDDVQYWTDKYNEVSALWQEYLDSLDTEEIIYVADDDVDVAYVSQGKLIPITFEKGSEQYVASARTYRLMPKMTRGGSSKYAATLAVKYNNFLKSGPKYEHESSTFEGEFERIAGITSSDGTNYDCKPTLEWRLGIVDEG